jgi:hypothetical protein
MLQWDSLLLLLLLLCFGSCTDRPKSHACETVVLLLLVVWLLLLVVRVLQLVVGVLQHLQWQASLLRVLVRLLLVWLLLRMLLRRLRTLLLLWMLPAVWPVAWVPLALLFGGVVIFKPQPLLFLLDRVGICDLCRRLLLFLHDF